MANFAINNETLRFVLKLVFLALFVSSSESWESPYREKNCGTLHSQNNLRGEQFPFKDGDQSANLIEDHRASLGWNITSSILVESGCSMEICNETYFDGACLPLEQGSYPSLSILPSNFTGDIASVRCNCIRECKCEDIFMKKSSCARAYLQGGCKTCNSMYFHVHNSSYTDWEYLEVKVESFRLRKGCKLTLYSEEDFEGEEEIISDEIFENYNGTFNSHECECNDDEYVPRVPPPRPLTFPPLVDIPRNVNDGMKMLSTETYSGHLGLLAALKSQRNNKSMKNAYILLLGSAGAGKSTAINLLFDDPNITKVDHGVSTSTGINEYRIPVPLDELGIANSELRVIDTPGVGDTRGLQQDAKFLATLESYLDNHEELKNMTPNVVLVFHKYNDNRLNEEGARFTKMLRGLDSFRHRITDEKYSNVIFVFSHFCSETKANRRQPTIRLNQFKSVIEDYTLFPNPIHLVVAENKPEENGLPLLNGYYKLPNNEFYPWNLFEKMELITKKREDIIGFEIFSTAFRDPENFNVTSSRFPIINKETPQVAKYLRILALPWSFMTPSILASAQKQQRVQKERQDLILRLEEENYNETRKVLVEMKLQELNLREKIRQEEKNSELELERSVLPLRMQLQSLLEGIEQEGGGLQYEKIERAHYDFYLGLRNTRQRVQTELEAKTRRHQKHLSFIKDQMKLLTEALHHKFSLQTMTWEREQRGLDLICNFNATQNATEGEIQANFFQDLKVVE